jgi:hypothetical protein
MTLVGSQVKRSIITVVRAAAGFAVWDVRRRPVSAEEAEAWSLRAQERRAKLKADASATSWPLAE